MSPIPFVATALVPSPATPSVALDPDSVGQSTSATSQHLFGTGGFVFAVVAIVSVAGYFYHGRSPASCARTSNTWASLSSFLSSMCHRGTAPTSTTAATAWPVDLVRPEHVSMVYARFFHPTSWNLMECHPATDSGPAIYVEDEAKEIPVSEPKRFGMNSFLDMDDDDGGGGGGGSPKHARENADQGARSKAEQLPPYDTSLSTNINFRSEIIGTTVRPGAFLSVPEDHDDSSETYHSDFDFTCSPYDGILTTPPGPPDELDSTCSAYEGILITPPGSSGALVSTCSAYDGILVTPPTLSDDACGTSSNSKLDLTCLPYNGNLTTPPRLSFSPRRYGMADMEDLARTLRVTIPKPGYHLVPTIPCRTGLCDLLQFVQTDSTMSRRNPDRREPVDNKPMTWSSDIDISAHDSRGGLRKNSSDAGPFAAPHEGLGLVRRLLEELRDPSMDCTPRALSEDSDSEYGKGDEDQGSVSPLTPTRGVDSMRWISLESDSSPPRTDGDVSDEGLICPLTPPARTATSLVSAPDIDKVRMPSPVSARLNEEVQALSPTSSSFPPLLPSKAYVRTQMEHRFLIRGRTSLPYLA